MGLSQTDWDLLLPQEWEIRTPWNGHSREFGLLNAR